jgi:hypothetical protein
MGILRIASMKIASQAETLTVASLTGAADLGMQACC